LSAKVIFLFGFYAVCPQFFRPLAWRYRNFAVTLQAIRDFSDVQKPLKWHHSIKNSYI
jgi:hypothetical protein